MKLTSVEICAGAGGQALGLELAGFSHLAAVEVDAHACNTLRGNRPDWNVVEGDLNHWDPGPYVGQDVDLVAGGVPCPPFSLAGKQLGPDDERDLFPRALEIIQAIRPKAVMLENVRGLLGPRFEGYRKQISAKLQSIGYPSPQWRLLQASDFGVPQLRPRAILVAFYGDDREFAWPEGDSSQTATVGETLLDLIGSNGWQGAEAWASAANSIAPTIVGGSKKHGGPDLGPTRSKQAWLKLGVVGNTIANAAPEKDFEGAPRLTTRMVARIQGFPDSWEFSGAKTHAYRQVGNAFPPPVAQAVGEAIRKHLESQTEALAQRPAEAA